METTMTVNQPEEVKEENKLDVSFVNANDDDAFPMIEFMSDKSDTIFHGTPAQRAEMFEAWAMYIGEVANPLKTAANYNKGNYAPLDEVLNETRPLLSKYGFGLIQVPQTDGDQVKLSTMITYKNGSFITFPPLTMISAKTDAQSMIATVTYARRAALNAILVIYGENDDDGNKASGNTGRGRKPKASTSVAPEDAALAKARAELVELCKKRSSEGVDSNTMYKIIADCNGGNKQPNRIPSVEICNEAMDKIKAL